MKKSCDKEFEFGRTPTNRDKLKYRESVDRIDIA